MKNSVFIVVPIVIMATIYLFWPAEQNKQEADSVPTNSENIKKNKVRIIAEESLGDSTKEDKSSESKVEKPTAGEKKENQSSPESVSQYVESTGASQEFHDLDAMLDNQIEQIVANSELSDDDKEQITKIFAEHINGEDLLKAYKAELANEFSEEELEKLGELNSDPLIKRVREDNPFNDPRIREQVSEYFADIEKNPLSRERQEMVKEIANATKGAEFIVDISKTMMENLGKHLGAKGDAPTPEEMQSFTEQLREEAENSVISGISFQTRNLSDQEMKSYGENQTHPLVQRDQNIRKGVAKRVTARMYSEIGKVGQ